MAEKKLLGLGERKLVGKPTKKKTKAGRTVYKTKEGELVSEKSSTIPIGDKWYNVPSIHAGKKYTEDELKIAIENNRLIPTSVHDNKEEAIDAAKKRSNKLYKGGTPMMNRQMDMFREGGLNQEGGMIDAESGNEVPVGSTREEVRDDIPAKLSEGEFVMPADVVRYHGLDKMMALRDEAKMGLRKMDAMGQMGNSDKAILPEEMPFGMADLIVVAEDGKEVEMAEGGYVTMANGGLTPNNNPLENTRQLGATYRPPTSQPIDFTKVMGDGGISFKQYRNANGENLLVSFIGGVPITPIPEGYTEYTPGADEPVTPIQEVVQLSPPTPVASDEDRQRAGYEEGYSIGIENMTPDQLIEENRRRTSIFGKLAGAIAFAINPAAGALYAFGVNRNKGKLLEAAKKNNMTDLASSIEKEKGLGGIVGGIIEASKNLIPESIKNSKVVKFITNIFNGEGSDPADIEEVTKTVKAETGMMEPRKRPVDPIARDAAYLRGEAAGTNARVNAERAAIAAANREGSLGGAAAAQSAAMSPTMSAIMGGVNKQRAERADGTLPAGVQVASNLSLASQMRNLGEPSAQSIDATAQSRDPRLGYESGQDALNEALVDGRIPLSDYRVDPQTGRYVGPANIPNRVYSPSNMQGQNFTPDLKDPRGPSQIPASTRPFPNYDYESNMRDRNMRPPAAGPTPYYDAFGNTTVFTGRERDRVDTGIPLGTDAAPGFFAYGDRNTQDEIDAATSAYASNAPRPYNDPGAYTSIPGMNVSPSNMQGQNFTPVIPSSIPAPTGFNFVEEERDRVRAGQPIIDQRDTFTQEADRLRELGRQEEARRMQSDRGFIPTNVVGARPDDATRFDARLSYQDLSEDQLIERSNNFDEAASNELRARNKAENQAALRESGLDMPETAVVTPLTNIEKKDPFNRFEGPKQEEILRQAEILRKEGRTATGNIPYSPSPIIARADERNFVQPDTRAEAMEANARRNAAAEQGTLITQLERPLATDIQEFPELKSGLRVEEPETSPSLMFPPSTAETQAAMLGAEGTGITPAESINRQRARNREESLGGAAAAPSLTTDITDSQLDSGMGGAIQSGRSPVSLDAPSMDMNFDPTRQPYDASFPREPAVPALRTTQSSLAPNYMVEAGRTGDPKLTNAETKQTINRVTSQRREIDYKKKVDSKEFDTRGRDTLLRSGKVVPKNSPMAVYNREQEETGYIGTDAEGYGVGMIAGPGQAGVVVDENGKALKDGPDGRTGKTIYQDSTGVQYTKSTFGKKETLDGKKYTPAEGAKKGDGLDRDNDNEADSGKIICTAMNASYGFGSYRQAIWLNYSNKHLTKAHEVGYHTLFLPLVYLAYTKDIKFIRTLLEHGTRRRTADLRAELKGTKRNTLGRFYRIIFEPLCYTVGKIKIALGN